jgi:hypothetical protein
MRAQRILGRTVGIADWELKWQRRWLKRHSPLTAKRLWVEFDGVFGTKETLNTRFAQLGELRNAIRHSRTLDDVTLKDGEASSLLWFGTALKTR